MREVEMQSDETIIIKRIVGMPLSSYESEKLTSQISLTRIKEILKSLKNPNNLTRTKFMVNQIVEAERCRIFANCEDSDMIIMDACDTIDGYEEKAARYIKKIKDNNLYKWKK